MSSLWTPGGEVPVDRERASARRSEPPPSEPSPRAEDQAAELQRFLLETPAADVVAQHAMGLYELAVIHLSQPDPRLDDARLAIDALAALLEGLEGRLGEAGRELRQALPQLQMAFVQIAERASGSGTESEGPETGEEAPPK